jgi:hypothetical protein
MRSVDELVEQTMVKVAAEPEPDLALLARLDQLRMQVRQSLARHGRRGRV